MKALKIWGCLLLSGMIFLTFILLPQNLVFESGESYTFYVGNTSKDCQVISSKTLPSLTKLTLKNICGESTHFSQLELNEFLQSVNGQIIFTETLSDSVNYYCKASLPYSVELYGQEINLHVCVKDDGVTVASPIIFGGY
jgi:hypothetical protein